MNALELADKLEQKALTADAMEYGFEVDFEEAATMLRQQQAEIEALKANRKHDFGLGEASGFIKGHKENPYKAITNTKIEPTVVSYTHPAELTDEEITAIAKEIFKDYKNFHHYQIDFARAVIKEVSGK